VKPDTKQYVDRLLISAGLRRTKQRIAVLSALLAARSPLTQDQITARLGSNAPNKVTIYRMLETLLKAGLVHKAFLQERTWHFELSDNCSHNQCHPHFICTKCGDTHCLLDVTLPMAKSPRKGFVINHQQVRLEGLCPECSKHVKKVS